MHFNLTKIKLEKESIVSSIFIIFTLFFTQLKVYALLAFILTIINYVLSKNIFRAVWISLVIVSLIPQVKYFPEQIFTTAQFLDLGWFPVIYSYYLDPKDVIIPLLIYLIIKHRKAFSSHLKPHSQKMPFFMIGVTILAIISSLQSNFPTISFFNTFILVKLFSLYILGTILTRQNPSLQKITVEIVLIFILINSMLVIFQQFHRGPLGIPLETLNSISSVGIYADENPNLYRPSGIFGSPNLIATLITLSLLISLPLMQSKKTIHRPLIISSLVVGLFALIATASRASWIIAVVVAMAMYYLKDVPSLTLESIKRSFVKTGLVVVVIGIIAFGWILPRLASLEKVFENHGGAQYRLRHIDIAKDFVLTYPFGVGANIFQFQIVKQYPADYIFADSTPAHNALAEIGSDFGFIGLILFPAMYYIIIKDAYRLKKVSVFNTCIFWALTSYLLSIQFHPWLFEKPIAELFWILSGVIRHEKSSYIETNHS